MDLDGGAVAGLRLEAQGLLGAQQAGGCPGLQADAERWFQRSQQLRVRLSRLRLEQRRRWRRLAPHWLPFRRRRGKAWVEDEEQGRWCPATAGARRRYLRCLMDSPPWQEAGELRATTWTGPLGLLKAVEWPTGLQSQGPESPHSIESPNSSLLRSVLTPIRIRL